MPKDVKQKAPPAGKPTAKRTPSKSRARRAPSESAPQKLKLLVTIVPRNKTELYTDLLHGVGINLHLVMLGKGTAGSATLSMLGLTDSDKCVIFSVIGEDHAREAMELLDEKFRRVRGGKGIAYTIPMSSVIGVAIYQFLSDNRMSVKEGGR